MPDPGVTYFKFRVAWITKRGDVKTVTRAASTLDKAVGLMLSADNTLLIPRTVRKTPIEHLEIK